MILQDEEWVTKEGKVIIVGDMSESHAKNCLRLMIRRQKQKEIRGFAQRFDGAKDCYALEWMFD